MITVVGVAEGDEIAVYALTGALIYRGPVRKLTLQEHNAYLLVTRGGSYRFRM